MEIFCLDADQALAQAAGAICCDALEQALAQARAGQDALLINVAAPDEFQGSYGNSQWTSKWTKLVGEARRRFDGVIAVSHRVPLEEAARRLSRALGAPGISPIRQDSGDGQALLAAWRDAGVIFFQEPWDADATHTVCKAATVSPDAFRQKMLTLRLRLHLTEAFANMRVAWHEDQNRQAALRILGGAVLSWLEDVYDPEPGYEGRPRGLSPSKAAEALQNWHSALTEYVDEEYLGDEDRKLRTHILGPLMQTLDDLGKYVAEGTGLSEPHRQTALQRLGALNKQVISETSPNPHPRYGVLIDDEAEDCGWKWILRILCRESFGLTLRNGDVETSFSGAMRRLSDTSHPWLENKHLVFLDLKFPRKPRGV